MDFFIFDYKQHDYLVDSLLEASAEAHKSPKKTKDWFYWKFKQNPFGKSIMACAKDQDKIVGCVAYGKQDFILNNKIIKGAISFETFVHPSYQRKGVFSKLLNLAESRAKEINVDLFLNFPNSNSLKGFINKGWKNINITEYWLKPKNLVKILFKLNDLRQTFIPNETNLKKLESMAEKTLVNNKRLKNTFELVLDKEYLNWRFFTYPNAEYAIVENDSFYSLGRIGYRGDLKEVQVLFVNYKDLNTFKIKSVLRKYKEKTHYDLISFPISDQNPLKKKIKKTGFIKVPNHTNMCYKILDKSLEINMAKLSLSAVNYHTY
ncbi:MAG: hypothetical protein CMC13_00080 [Flavobacteriaceae bacterium]|nr:hypothetical protein [Flavobacteriaceae bacterium]|tara:strand:+ start:7257 stop:8216 length:960 start_codon:yes stop_codon:yes gene_type:complete